MPLRIRFGYDEDDLLAAQWRLITAFEQGLASCWPDPARQTLRDRLAQIPRTNTTPTHWMTALAQSLLGLIATLQAAQDSNLRAALTAAESDRDSLQRVLLEYQQHPLQDQLAACTRERDLARAQVQQQAARVTDLNGALQRAQAAQAAEVQRLQQEIASLRAELATLNRLVVEQQEALYGCAH